jgi:putative ABC transport system substrate-binding protein
MRRREFIGGLGSAAAWPLAVRAQRAPKRIGFLASGAASSPASATQIVIIKQGLQQHGLIDGRDYVLETRFAAGNYERFPTMARELAQAGTDVILTNTIASVRAAQGLLPPVPVVMIAINDPVGAGLVASLGKPGGHTTGMATLNEDLTSKVLEFQQAVVPAAKTTAALFNPANPTNLAFLNSLRSHANGMGMTVLPVEVRTPDALDAAFSAVVERRPNTIQVISDSGILDLSDRIASLALSHRLPSFATSTVMAEFGGLLAYGSSRRALFVRSAYFVKKILEGVHPADLPVEQPTRIELWINLKTAKTLGITVPPPLLARADEVIE